MKAEEQETRRPRRELRSLKDLTGYPIEATDGEIGKCRDFLFDDERWTIRYLVADTRKWLPGRKVLISPYQFGQPEAGDYASKHFRVNLDKERIKEGPELDEDAPVSRLHELEMARFYHYPPYWVGHSMWGVSLYPTTGENLPPTPGEWERHAEELRRIEQHRLRSVNEVTGYAIEAEDEGIGHVEDFVVETPTWAIRWMIVDTRNWLPGRKVIISPDWIEEVNWSERKVAVQLLKSQIEKAPEYLANAPINRDYEGNLYDFYGRPTYW